MAEDQAASARNRPDDPSPGSSQGEPGGTSLSNTPTDHHGNGLENPVTISLPENAVSCNDEPIPGNRRGNIRFKWSMEMNIDLYRTYLLLTKMETDKTPYGHKLHRTMIEKWPQLAGKSLMNILSQRRELFTKQRIPHNIVQQIRNEIAVELGLQPAEILNENHKANPDEPTTRLVETEPSEKLTANILLYQGMDPNSRPRLPKLKTNKQTNNIIQKVNAALVNKIDECADLQMLHDLVYAAAVTIIELHKQVVINEKTIKPKPSQPKWKKRLTLKINNIRREIGLLTQKINLQNNSTKVEKRTNIIITRYTNTTNTTPEEVLDFLKQKLKVYSYRLKRYQTSYERRNDNQRFNTNKRLFYRNLLTPQTNEQEGSHPTADEIKNYWSNIWEKPGKHKHSAKWMELEKKRVERIPYMLAENITEQDIKNNLSRTQNWKAPGPDSIHNFWYKKLTNTHRKMAELLTETLNNPETTPIFMMQGITHLLPKSTCPQPDPSKYRPITCLPTLYKLLTSIIADKIYRHMEKNKLLAEEQKGCRKESRGCKEQLIIDSVVTQEALVNKRELHTAFIDYQKAFDSVPHTWLIECLEIYKINQQIINFLRNAMSKWETKLTIPNSNQQSVSMKIKRGIYQGDALSALWFCITINPLSNALNNKKCGYKIPITNQQVSHQIYMDDIKLYSDTSTGLKKLLRQTETFSADIGMKFGVDKCRSNSIVKGKWHKDEGFRMLQRSGGGLITPMERDESYKYLGFLQSQGINQKQVKAELINKMKVRLKAILRSHLSARNKIEATNTLAAPVITYSFGVLKWTETDLEELNRTIRRMYTKYRAHHPRACKERFHLPRNQGGRGITDFRLIHQNEVNNLREFFHRKGTTSPLHDAINHTDQKLTQLQLSNRNFICDPEYSTKRQLEKWKQKELHGRYIHSLNQEGIDRKATNGWLLHGNIFPETEGFLCAIQDQIVPTKSYLKYIIKDPTIPHTKCRMCGQGHENIEHLLNSCTVLAPREYTNRHNDVAKIVHRELSIKYGFIETREPYYKYRPTPVLESEKATIYWDRSLLTDRPLPDNHNKPDIFLWDKTNNIILLIDIAIPTPKNIHRKHNEKIEKYLPLCQELENLWRAKYVRTIPVVIGATGEIPTKLFDALKQLDIQPTFYLEMQKATILATCNIMRRILNIKVTNT